MGRKGWLTSLIHKHFEHPFSLRSSPSGNRKSCTVTEDKTGNGKGLFEIQYRQQFQTFEIFLGAKATLLMPKEGNESGTRCVGDASILARKVFSRLFPLGQNKYDDLGICVRCIKAHTDLNIGKGGRCKIMHHVVASYLRRAARELRSIPAVSCVRAQQPITRYMSSLRMMDHRKTMKSRICNSWKRSFVCTNIVTQSVIHHQRTPRYKSWHREQDDRLNAAQRRALVSTKDSSPPPSHRQASTSSPASNAHRHQSHPPAALDSG